MSYGNKTENPNLDDSESIMVARPEDSRLILAVDDMPDVLNTIKTHLNDFYQIQALTSGSAAIKFLEARIPKVIILDIEMPGMSGYETAITIRKMTHLKYVPILYLSTNATEEAVVSAYLAGASDFIVKPIAKEILLRKVRRFLR